MNITATPSKENLRVLSFLRSVVTTLNFEQLRQVRLQHKNSLSPSMMWRHLGGPNWFVRNRRSTYTWRLPVVDVQIKPALSHAAMFSHVHQIFKTFSVISYEFVSKASCIRGTTSLLQSPQQSDAAQLYPPAMSSKGLQLSGAALVNSRFWSAIPWCNEKH